ncbi:hypothetical protein DFH09DRAFT_1274853 [Mycena vulgaris]|nr:hypothetical protein DFH09DRAFT_1274853 [Mycena vulgaris]
MTNITQARQTQYGDKLKAKELRCTPQKWGISNALGIFNFAEHGMRSKEDAEWRCTGIAARPGRTSESWTQPNLCRLVSAQLRGRGTLCKVLTLTRKLRRPLANLATPSRNRLIHDKTKRVTASKRFRNITQRRGQKLELARVKLENKRLEGEVRALSRELSEILLLVLRYALPPPWLLDGETSLPPFSQSIWSIDLRAKLCLVRVCKAWHRIGLEFLYRRVTLRRIGQMPAFVSALEVRNGLGAFVRNLYISCFVPHGYLALYNQEIKKIFQLCPQLSHFAFKPPFHIPTSPNMIPAVSGNVTSLEYNHNVEYPLILPTLVQLCKILRSLALFLPTTYDASHSTLRFQQLEDLHIQGSVAPPPKWRTPSLRRLWLDGSSSVDNAILILEAEAFLNVYGRTIIFLSLKNYGIGHTSIQGALDRCPLLERLAINEFMVHPTCPPLSHQNITSLDFFGWRQPKHFRFFNPDLNGFSALRTWRLLDESMHSLWNVPSHIPRDIERQWVIDDGAPKSAWVSALMVVDIDDVCDSSVDDSETGDVDSDSDAESCVTVSEDGGYASMAGEFYLEEEREFGHDEALTIFWRL